MGLYEVPLSMFYGGMGTMLPNFHNVWHSVGTRNSIQQQYSIVCLLLCKEEVDSPVSLQLLR